MKWVKRLLAFVPALVLGFLYLRTKAQETEIIIYKGIDSYRQTESLLSVLLGIAVGGALIINVITPIIRKLIATHEHKQELVKKAELEQSIQHATQLKSAVLARKDGRWDETSMAQHLQNLLDNPETPISLMEFLSQYESQMQRMNTWQARLSNLIRTNAATDLHKAEDLLDKLEQNMLGRLRKAFNWIQMTDMTEAAITDELKRNLRKIQDENDTILQKAQSLCETLTTYLNTQDEDKTSINQLEHFIVTLNEQIQEEQDTVVLPEYEGLVH